MRPRDLASNLEFWSGRGRSNAAGEDPARRRPSFRPSPFRRWWLRVSSWSPSFPWRPVAAAALIAGLTAAWLIVGHQSTAPASSADAPPFTGPPTTAAVRTSTTTTPRPTPSTVPVTPDCRGLSPSRREVRCVIDAIAVDIRLLSSAAIGAAYRKAAGAEVAARSGAPACAHGAPDERAWSVATAPINAIGRYRCRVEQGHAAMWWTHGDRLVHAVAPDGDLAALFLWWRMNPVG